METISVSSLKAHLSEQLRKVEAGESIVVLDHKRPVAVIRPPEVGLESLFVQKELKPFVFQEHEPLSDIDPLLYLMEDREDRC